MGIDDLVNKGFLIVNKTDSSFQEEKTIIVVGVARGGTSIVSGVLHHLGIFMGDKSHPPVFEDVRLSAAYEGKSDESFDDVVGDYNSRYAVWGWKRPAIIKDIHRVKTKVRNPHFIYIFRDVFSIANRNRISMHTDVKSGIAKAIKDYALIAGFLEKDDSPSLLLSSDKSLIFRQEVVNEISDFCGINTTDEKIQKAISFISEKPVFYLDSSRITKTNGTINKSFLRTGVLRGWAKNIHTKNTVQIEVRADDKLVATLNADTYFQHLKENGVHPTGKCGFICDLKKIGVKPRSKISVRAKGDVVDLNNSPAQFENMTEWMTLEEWKKNK